MNEYPLWRLPIDIPRALAPVVRDVVLDAVDDAVDSVNRRPWVTHRWHRWFLTRRYGVSWYLGPMSRRQRWWRARRRWRVQPDRLVAGPLIVYLWTLKSGHHVVAGWRR